MSIKYTILEREIYLNIFYEFYSRLSSLYRTFFGNSRSCYHFLRSTSWYRKSHISYEKVWKTCVYACAWRDRSSYTSRAWDTYRCRYRQNCDNGTYSYKCNEPCYHSSHTNIPFYITRSRDRASISLASRKIYKKSEVKYL